MPKNERYHVVRRATIVNSSINSLLALFKIVLGLLGHSQALVADGIHSFADLITDALVLFASKVGTQKPDKEHPYGHRRVETMASIILSLVLTAVAIGIAYDTLHPIFSGAITESPTYFVIIVAVVSILANEFLYRYTLYEANTINSDLLRSNALHNRSDVLVSIIVLISVVGAYLGVHYLDAIGALVIAAVILKMALKMIWDSTKELIDTGVDDQFNQEIIARILENPDVHAIHQLRTRTHGENVFVDLHIEVNPAISVSEAHYISEQVNIDLIKNFKRITDVTVHIDPEDDQHFILSKDLPNRKIIEDLLAQRWEKLPSYREIHKILLHYLRGKIAVELYLPIQILNNKLEAKQKIQTDFEAAIADIKYIRRVTINYQ